MKITVHVHNALYVHVRCAPSWLDKLLGREAIDDYARRAGKLWLWESRNELVRVRDRRVLAAIERALKQ